MKKRIGNDRENIDTLYVVFKPAMVDEYALLLNCTCKAYS